ncbi:MAG: glucuronate isomerase [Chloroflexi bacterium]|nr:glucuronate isomerase [Chloroflexota bacterium]
MSERYLNSQLAAELYHTIANLPYICPHGHVDPRMFAEANYSFGTPVDLLIIPDHYIFRMLYSQGISLESLGIPRRDGGAVEQDHRRIWQTFADHFYLFRGTPTGIWIRDELEHVFGISQKLTGSTAQAIYDAITAKLAQPDFTPRRLFERFNIETLATTDTATDSLSYHTQMRASGWSGHIIPTFRPDAVVNLDSPNWLDNIQKLSQISGVSIHNYASFIQALEQRRAFFKQMGAVATDHAALTAYTEPLTATEANRIFQQALKGDLNPDDTRRFTGHLLIEMARMSVEDGLVMQLHIGAFRNHNSLIFEHFGRDMGGDIPIQTEFTRALRPLLECYGNDPRLTLILFTLDETTYSRELAPLAGHYPTLRLGPPWWFFDSFNGMAHYFDQVIETAGLYNTVGFNDDTRAFPSIPARHDVWRRASANWVAGLVTRHIVDEEDAAEMMHDLAYGLVKQAYRLGD